jgi:predicted transcriptional regulator
LRRIKELPSTELHTSLNQVIVFWLAKELEKEIPDLDLYGAERKLLDFACKDLEAWLEVKREDANATEIEKISDVRENQEEIKAFLKVWTSQWLEKWRERVTLCQKMPTFSLKQVKRKKKAKKLLELMEEGHELKKYVVQKLVNQGEICMSELIAENLVIEQIAYRLTPIKGKASASKTEMEPWQILQEVLPNVNSLAKRKMPLIHMRVMIGN